MTATERVPVERKTHRFRPAANWVAVIVVPLGVFVATLVADLNAGDRVLYNVDRFALLALFAAVIQCVILAATVPWWSAGLLDTGGFGALISALRVLAMTLATTVLLLVLALLQDRAGAGAMLKIQLVVFAWGLALAGLAGVLRVLLRRTTVAAVLTSVIGLLVVATPFWGNVLIAVAGRAGRVCVVAATPLSAASDAVGQAYDVFHGRLLYDLSVVGSGAAYALPVWWVWALVTGLVGVAMVVAVTFIRRHLIIR